MILKKIYESSGKVLKIYQPLLWAAPGSDMSGRPAAVITDLIKEKS